MVSNWCILRSLSLTRRPLFSLVSVSRPKIKSRVAKIMKTCPEYPILKRTESLLCLLAEEHMFGESFSITYRPLFVPFLITSP